MSKFRIILFTLLGSLIVLMGVSITGVLPNRYFTRHAEVHPEDLEEKAIFVDEGPPVDYVMIDFYLPHYDEKGKEAFTIKGERATLINNELYKIQKPEIALRGGLNLKSSTASESSKDTQPEQETGGEGVVISSRRGEINKDTKESLLVGEVMVKFNEGTTLKTEDLRYYPNENEARTDRAVTLEGSKLKIRGDGLEAELSTGRIWIERGVIAEMEEVKGNLLLPSVNVAAGKEDARGKEGRTIISCNGKLVFEREANMLTFHDRVRARKGNSTLSTDKLVLVFDESAQKVKMLIAQGNVFVSDISCVAKGNSLLWDAITDAITLEGTPFAELFEEKFSLVSPKIVFSQGGQRADASNGGRLTTKEALKTNATKKDSLKVGPSWGQTNITWKGKMNFQKERGQATFEEDVQLNRKGYSLYCQKMMVSFGEKEMKVEAMEAAGGVYVVEKGGEMLREASAEEGYWNFEKDMAELKGEGTLFIQTEEGQEKKGVKIDWDRKMLVEDSNTKITFHENVRAIRDLQKVNCNQLNVFLEDSSKLEKIVALGDVHFTDNREGGIESIGDIMEWDYRTDRVVISGEPTAEVRRKTVRTFAKRIYYNVKTQQVAWKDRPHWEMPMEKKGEITDPFGLTP